MHLPRLRFSAFVYVALLLQLITTSCQTEEAVTLDSPEEFVEAYTTLTTGVNGLASLSWQPATRTIHIAIWIGGLQRNSRYTISLYRQHCASGGKRLYSIGRLLSDRRGRLSTSIDVPGGRNGIPRAGWFLGVYRTGISQHLICSEVSGSSFNEQQDITVPLQEQRNRNAPSGTASLLLQHRQLSVTLIVERLKPNTIYQAALERGHCYDNRVPLYPLRALRTDVYGRATAQTIIPAVEALPSSEWSIVIPLYSQNGTANLCGTLLSNSSP
uniref:Uncharacterized protein n=1 Tax=Thermosporothrix sp. COM3 TaxID=2490863 RepID=A0A455STQ6_9CHLR|nr:hypothetical protein KTC_57570 [Thermosporothrix sp. COM3]